MNWTHSFLIMSLLIFTLAICIFIEVRNFWVLKNRIKLIKNSSLSKYLSYDQMMLKFWIWNVEKLKKNK